jgi:hypothetical protein
MIGRRARLVAIVAAFALVGTACTIEFGTPPDGATGLTSPDPSP